MATVNMKLRIIVQVETQLDQSNDTLAAAKRLEGLLEMEFALIADKLVQKYTKGNVSLGGVSYNGYTVKVESPTDEDQPNE